MVSKIKSGIKTILQDVQQKKYTRELLSQKMDYDSWIRGQEAPLLLCRQPVREERDRLLAETESTIYEIGGMKMRKVSGEQFMRLLPEIARGEIGEQVLLVCINEGKLSDLAIPLIYAEFLKEEKPMAVYGDEDVCEDTTRKQPWFKPDWSPDTFLSGFYIGSMVALSTERLYRYLKDNGREPHRTLYELLFALIRDCGGFSSWKKSDLVVRHIPQVLYHTVQNGYEQLKSWRLPDTTQFRNDIVPDDENGQPYVSVIIPSKDHPDILFRCLDSFLEKTTNVIEVDNYFKYEFIIVDNGSSSENRTRIEEKIQAIHEHTVYQKQGFIRCRYRYAPMTFNFSRMCNLGAKEASGNYLLFLNDDMEILSPSWLSELLQKSMLPYVGAVGAKLLYPETDLIQHAGITNLRVGPAHKLQRLHDTQDHYYGRNRGVHDMLGVTGACLLVRKEIFEEVSGFDEELAVAFNDVDLCYKIYEAGYYNVVRNDVILSHHESLSRGNDGESEEKQKRLLAEKDLLYKKHTELYGRDPFYHPYLTTDMLEAEYTPAYRYQVDLSIDYAKVRDCTKEVNKVRCDPCLVVGMECAMDIFKWVHGVSKEMCEGTAEEDGYYVQGYSFVIGANNACYKKELLLQECPSDQEDTKSLKVYGVSVRTKYRADIRDHLQDQRNVDLTGYTAKFREKDIPPGTYRFGMLAKDCSSRMKLVNWSSWTITIG